MVKEWAGALALALTGTAAAKAVHVYVGQVTATSALIAWGRRRAGA